MHWRYIDLYDHYWDIELSLVQFQINETDFPIIVVVVISDITVRPAFAGETFRTLEAGGYWNPAPTADIN